MQGFYRAMLHRARLRHSMSSSVRRSEFSPHFFLGAVLRATDSCYTFRRRQLVSAGPLRTSAEASGFAVFAFKGWWSRVPARDPGLWARPGGPRSGINCRRAARTLFVATSVTSTSDRHLRHEQTKFRENDCATPLPHDS